MIASKMSVLKPLIESKDGQHLTAYLQNDQNVIHLRRQLRGVIETADEFLAPVMSPEALIRFVAPLHNALDDTKLLKNLKGNVGVFRNETSFRILSLPVPVDTTCIVATTFHVKPLLRWIQMNREFLILGIDDVSASLYQGNQNNLTLDERSSEWTENPGRLCNKANEAQRRDGGYKGEWWRRFLTSNLLIILK